jgi:hypothetical protein
MTSINQYEKKIYSQNGEDGVIQHIFDTIGVTNKTFVEFGFHVNENNSKHLIKRYGFKGLYIDSDIPVSHRNKTIDGIHYHQSWITKQNINTIISTYFNGSIDFLSIDVDGVDLHLLDYIHVVQPRVVCIEYCASIGKDLSVTVPYKDHFDRHKEHISGMYCNASLKANIYVMKKKGYRFVASVYGLNAFFIRNDCDMKHIKELSCEEGWQPHYSRTYQSLKRHDGKTRTVSIEEQYNLIKHLKWIPVDEHGNILQ